MPSPFDPLVDLIHSGTLNDWYERNNQARAALFGTRYSKRAESSTVLRAPDMRGATDSNVPYAGYLHPTSQGSGVYGGMSFVLFPVENQPCLFGMVSGSQGLSPDEQILGRPGHARKVQAVCNWLNYQFGKGTQVAWAKQDPTRTDIPVPKTIQDAWSPYDTVFNRYGRYLYGMYRPSLDDRAGTLAALTAMLDLMFEERGQMPLKEFQEDRNATRSAWFSHLMPQTTNGQIIDLLNSRRFVVLQGPPGTGKTRAARQILDSQYHGHGRTVQFHPSTTYENFVGGLAPVQTTTVSTDLGFRFAPKPGFLIEAAAQAAANPTKPYLLHIDEINRADLGKILGEAIYLLEPTPESPRTLDLPYDFGPPFHQRLSLPPNLHLLGTMNSADRSIAIVDVAVRRRFAFLSLWPNQQAVQDLGCEIMQKAFQDLVTIFVEHAPDEALALVPGHSYFLEKDETQARINLRTSLAPLLTEYLAQGYVSGFAESIRSYLQWLESL